MSVCLPVCLCVKLWLCLQGIRVFLFFSFLFLETMFYCLSQVGLEIEILLSKLPKCKEYRKGCIPAECYDFNGKNIREMFASPPSGLS